MSDSENMSPEIMMAATAAVSNLIPTKSTNIYNATYEKFLKWCQDRNVANYDENVLLAYFSYLANTIKLKCSTMWSQYSMIKLLLNIKCGTDISKYLKLRAYLKRQNDGYTAKKSKVLTKNEFEKFLSDAPDFNYLGKKIVLIIGIFGACRCEELVKMKVTDIEDVGTLLYIKVPDGKTKKNRTFTVVGKKYLDLYRNYITLRPAFEDQRLFLRYQNGKCYRAVMGIHKIGCVPKEVAEFLGLPNSNQYTGHCLRRTSATLLVDGGADITCLKRHGGWKSNSVAEGYIEDSIVNKNEIAHKILNSSSSSNTVEEILPTTTNLIKSQQSWTSWGYGLYWSNTCNVSCMFCWDYYFDTCLETTFLNIMRLMYELGRIGWLFS